MMSFKETGPLNQNICLGGTKMVSSLVVKSETGPTTSLSLEKRKQFLRWRKEAMVRLLVKHG